MHYYNRKLPFNFRFVFYTSVFILFLSVYQPSLPIAQSLFGIPEAYAAGFAGCTLQVATDNPSQQSNAGVGSWTSYVRDDDENDPKYYRLRISCSSVSSALSTCKLEWERRGSLGCNSAEICSSPSTAGNLTGSGSAGINSWTPWIFDDAEGGNPYNKFRINCSSSAENLDSTKISVHRIKGSGGGCDGICNPSVDINYGTTVGNEGSWTAWVRDVTENANQRYNQYRLSYTPPASSPPPSSCSAGYICTSSTQRCYQSSTCSLSSCSTCTYGCSGGSCNPAPPPSPPGTPTLTSVTPGCSGSTPTMSVAWSGGSGATTFYIYRCLGTCTPTTQIGTDTASPYLDSNGLSNSTSYSYRVRAYNGSFSNYSNTMTRTTNNCSAPPPASANLVAAWVGGVPVGAPGTQSEVEVQIFDYTSPVGPFEVAVNANSANNNCSTVDSGLFDTHAVSGMSPGSLNLYSNELMLTRPASFGSYTGIVMVDSDCQINETDEQTSSNTRTFSYVVMDYFLTNGGNVSVAPGQQITNSITATMIGGPSQPILFISVSGLPAGASASFSPTFCSPSPSDCSTTLTITTNASTPVGDYPITVTSAAGSTSGLQRTTQFTLSVGGLQCSDGNDNDLDGFTDMDDPGCSSPGDNDESDDPELEGTLSATPDTGNSPLLTSLFAQITSVTWAPTTNYSFWWDCSYVDSTPTYGEAATACGALLSTCSPGSVGIKCDGESFTSFSKPHTYTNTSQNPISVRPIVIIQHGNQAVLGNDSVTVNPALPDVTCSPSSLNATRGSSRTFNASGGSGNFSWTVTPSANCTPTSGSGNSFDVSCSTNGIREIQVDDDDSNTAPDTCLLQVTQPGLIEI